MNRRPKLSIRKGKPTNMPLEVKGPKLPFRKPRPKMSMPDGDVVVPRQASPTPGLSKNNNAPVSQSNKQQDSLTKHQV